MSANTLKKAAIVVDQKVAQKVAKATALAKRLGPKGFEMVKPPTQLRQKVRPKSIPGFNPIEAAEKNIERISSGFTLWLQDDMENLTRAYQEYALDPQDTSKFQTLNAAIHTIKGNAPILGYDAVGMMASPLADLMEGCSDHEKAVPILALTLNAISRAIAEKTPIDDEDLAQTIAMLNQLNSQCIAKKACSIKK